MNKGELFIISAPSGAGKSSLIQEIIKRGSASGFLIELSVSATTRSPRSNDIEGKDYFFISQEKFSTFEEEDAFIESAIVHGNKYGTLKDYVDSKLSKGINLILEIDVQGIHKKKRKNIPKKNRFTS